MLLRRVPRFRGRQLGGSSPLLRCCQLFLECRLRGRQAGQRVVKGSGLVPRRCRRRRCRPCCAPILRGCLPGTLQRALCCDDAVGVSTQRGCKRCHLLAAALQRRPQVGARRLRLPKLHLQALRLLPPLLQLRSQALGLLSQRLLLLPRRRALGLPSCAQRLCLLRPLQRGRQRRLQPLAGGRQAPGLLLHGAVPARQLLMCRSLGPALAWGQGSVGEASMQMQVAQRHALAAHAACSPQLLFELRQRIRRLLQPRR